jgi:tRNA pseudouridine55 synthase
VKVDGERAYDRARAGEDVELTPRIVTIHSLAMIHDCEREPLRSVFATTLGRPDGFDPRPPLELADSVTLLTTVSKGTYIRSLARDIAHALGTVGHVTFLRRTRAGPFTEAQAISLDKLNAIGKGAPLEDILLPLEAGLDGIPALSLDPDSARAVRQGRVISGLPHPDGLILARAGNVPVALMEVTAGTAKVVRGFNIHDTAE